MKLPIEINNSRIPGLIGKLTGMRITGFSFGIWIFCSGTFSTRMRNHELIHFAQQRELLWVGQWLLYSLSFIINMIRFKFDVRKSYRLNVFELEAYDMDACPHYLQERPMYNWLKYIRKS